MKKWITYVIVAVIIAAAVGGVIVRSHYLTEDEEEVISAETGDTVLVHYTGWLNDDRIYDSRRVFDSSQPVVSEETTVTFQERERGEPFRFTVGSGVIEGWSEAVVGMREGQTKVVNIPTEKAYDTYSEDLVFEVDRVENIPVYETMSGEDFLEEYEIYPYPNLKVTHAFWNWDSYVEQIQGDEVTLRHSPEVDVYYDTYREDGVGWSSKVVSVDSNADGGQGRIVVRNHVELGTVVDSERLSKRDDAFEDVSGIKRAAGQQGTPTGIVVGISEDYITIDFNEEVAGKTLTFKITLLEITEQE